MPTASGSPASLGARNATRTHRPRSSRSMPWPAPPATPTSTRPPTLAWRALRTSSRSATASTATEIQHGERRQPADHDRDADPLPDVDDLAEQQQRPDHGEH